MNEFANPFFNPYRVYSPPQRMYSYGYPPIYFERVENVNTENNRDYIDAQEQNPWNPRYEANAESQTSFKLNDIISLDNDRLSLLGFSINIDDLIILITLFTMFKSGEKIDYTLVIILGLLLFSQD